MLALQARLQSRFSLGVCAGPRQELQCPEPRAIGAVRRTDGAGVALSLRGRSRARAAGLNTPTAHSAAAMSSASFLSLLRLSAPSPDSGAAGERGPAARDGDVVDGLEVVTPSTVLLDDDVMWTKKGTTAAMRPAIVSGVLVGLGSMCTSPAASRSPVPGEFVRAVSIGSSSAGNKTGADRAPHAPARPPVAVTRSTAGARARKHGGRGTGASAPASDPGARKTPKNAQKRPNSPENA